LLSLFSLIFTSGGGGCVFSNFSLSTVTFGTDETSDFLSVEGGSLSQAITMKANRIKNAGPFRFNLSILYRPRRVNPVAASNNFETLLNGVGDKYHLFINISSQMNPV
jgi:hypothetical protein